MSYKHFTIIPLFLILVNGFSQNISVNYDIDTSIFKVSKPLNLWLNFLQTRDDLLGAKYWNNKEVKQYGQDAYFLIENELQFGPDNYLSLLGSYADIEVLSIRKNKEYYKITSLMKFKPKGEKSNIQYIFHVYAGMENEELKLFNALDINTKLHLNTSVIGYIKFHYPKTHTFNKALAKKQNDFLVDFSKNFDVPIDTIDYYFTSTNEEIQRIKGFDFLIGDNGEQIPAGRADSQNRIVYSAGLGEYYPHEFIHILINPHYPKCHLWINEGIATFFGQSRGKNLDWHLNKVKDHLVNHPEINLNNLLELRNLDQYTGYRYALGGFIVRKVFQKGGYNLLKKMMNSGTTDTDFYQTIEENLGIKQQDINAWIRNEIKSTNH